MFEPLPAQFRFPEAEERILQFWQEHDIFGQSLRIRQGAPRFVFYEGPPTANGLPHPGHCLTRSIKDLFPRYQTMCGKLVERKAGWDTHGLPVEVEVCKELGIHTKEEIEQYGVEKFVRKCIESVFRYTREWEQMTRRLGFWVNLQDAYVTFHQSYVESVWWSLKTLFDRGLLYQGHKVVWWWAQGGTALSAGEVGEGYRTVKDPSVYIRFPLVAGAVSRQPSAVSQTEVASAPGGRRSPHEDLPPGSKVSLLVWTTTPWTLVSNHFAAVGPDVDYSLVHDEPAGEYFYIATALVAGVAEKIKRPLVEVGTCKGGELVGLRYMPPFDCYAKTMASRTAAINGGGAESIAWRVVPADFIDLATGTGIVHIAPAYGEVDFNLLQDERQRFADFDAIPLINAVAPDGNFTAEAPQAYRGRWVKDCDKEIMRELKDRGVLLHQETIEHEYPFCPRAEDDPLIQYARKSWFVRTSQFKDEFLANNEKINWLPEHIKEGRFGDFLRNNVDWALSRERYWGTPLPIWVCEKTGKMEAIGSLAELMAKPGATDATPEYPQGMWASKKAKDSAIPDHLRVHKPYIDAWTYDSPFLEGGAEGSRGQGAEGAAAVSAVSQKPRMRRVPEVIDCWWDAGSMPFAQWGFPHTPESIRTFVERFPCDFISEAIDQTRGWFYGLLAISTLLFGGVGVSPARTGVPAETSSAQGSAGVSPARTGVPAETSSAQGSAGVSPARTGVLREPITRSLQTRRRWKLPHWEAGGSTHFLTFRVAQGQLSDEERTLVLDACKHWDGTRFVLHAAVVMPDHVHLLLTPQEESPGRWWSIADLMHGIKGFAAKGINARRGMAGSLWQAEYYDRIIRSAEDYEEKWGYVVENPLRRNLGEDYPWVWAESPAPEPTQAHPGTQDNCGPTCGRDARTPRRDYPLPYRTCIVLGHVMGEDALKMSKRTKNYKEPGFIFDTYGADAMRWFFFSAQTPWTSIRFQEANIRDAQREFLVRLYNVFSFFNIYANIDGFEAAGGEGMRGSGDEGEERPRVGRPHVPTSPRPHASGQRPVPQRAATGQRPVPQQAATGQRPVPQRSELDRWIISELHRTIRFVREKLDAFENYPAAGRINDFVDALSNWYVRRSRERFWRPVIDPRASARAASSPGGGPRDLKVAAPQDQDKWDAYNTLYEVLLSLSQLIAPFTPFFAEVMYQNLARGQGVEGQRGQAEDAALPRDPRTLGPSDPRTLEPSTPRTLEPSTPRPLGPSDPRTLEPSTPRPLEPLAPPLSVHLCDYPAADETLIDEKLAQEMDLVRDIVSLGRAARTAAKLKVRQPLALAEVILVHREHSGWLDGHAELIAEELNIKRVEFTAEADHYVSYQIKPDFKALGPKFGKQAPKIAAAMQTLDASVARQSLASTGELIVYVDGESVRLSGQEVQVRLEAKPGWSAAQGRAGVVVVKTEMTPELLDEGVVRELIHHVQGRRKDESLAYQARIRLWLEATPKLGAVVERFADTIRQECLADEILLAGAAIGEVHEVPIEGQSVKMAIAVL